MTARKKQDESGLWLLALSLVFKARGLAIKRDLKALLQSSVSASSKDNQLALKQDNEHLSKFTLPKLKRQSQKLRAKSQEPISQKLVASS
jgi:hypothetical protein